MKLSEQDITYIKATSFKLTGSFQDAQDLFGSVLLKLVDKEEPDTNKKGYISRTITTTNINMYRSPMDKFTDFWEHTDLLEDPVFINEEVNYDKLYDAIAKLAPNHNKAIVLFMAGHKHKEIADIMGISHVRAKELVRYGIAKLRNLLTDSDGPMY